MVEAELLEFLVHLGQRDVAVRRVDDDAFGFAADAFHFALLAGRDRLLEVAPGIAVVEVCLGQPVVILEAAQRGLFFFAEQVVGQRFAEHVAPGFGLRGAGAFRGYFQRFEHLVGLGEVHVAAGGGLEDAQGGGADLGDAPLFGLLGRLAREVLGPERLQSLAETDVLAADRTGGHSEA